MFNDFQYDYKKLCGKKWGLTGLARLFKNNRLRFLCYGRMSVCNFKVICLIGRIMLRRYEVKYGLEIGFQNVGKGLLIVHPYNITVNSKAALGEDVTLFKGSTIGSVRSGKKQGVPTIGNRVAALMNSTIVGNVKIGNDVLICANTFVDFDVPDHSMVIGNPAVVKYRPYASKDYLSGV